MAVDFVDHYGVAKYGYKTAFPHDSISNILRHVGGAKCADCGIYSWQSCIGLRRCYRCGESLCDSCFHYPVNHPHEGYIPGVYSY